MGATAGSAIGLDVETAVVKVIFFADLPPVPTGAPDRGGDVLGANLLLG